MREDTKARLEVLMTRYEKWQATLRRRQELARRLYDVFITEFEETAKAAIRPAMEEVGGALRGRGHDYEICATQGYTDFRGRVRNTQIMMRFYPAGIERSLFTTTNTPYVAFAGDWLEKRIAVLESTLIPLGGWKAVAFAGNGKTGKRGTYTLKQLTPPVIEREIVDVLAGVFGRDRLPYSK